MAPYPIKVDIYFLLMTGRSKYGVHDWFHQSDDWEMLPYTAWRKGGEAPETYIIYKRKRLDDFRDLQGNPSKMIDFHWRDIRIFQETYGPGVAGIDEGMPIGSMFLKLHCPEPYSCAGTGGPN